MRWLWLSLVLTAADLKQQQKANEDMLHWAIQNSDPEKLRDLAAKYKEQNLTIADVVGEDTIQAATVTETEVLRELIGKLVTGEDLDPDDVAQILESIGDIVHQVDMAADLDALGGLDPVLALAFAEDVDSEVRAEALGVLAILAANNDKVQAQFMEREPTVLAQLGALLRAARPCTGRVCARAVFALSALASNQRPILEAAVADGSVAWLCESGLATSDAKVTKKVAIFLESVALAHPDVLPEPCVASLPARLQALVASADLDLAEKAFALYTALQRSGLHAADPGVLAAFAQTVQSCRDAHGADDAYCADLAAAHGEL